ncbi:MAG: RNA polymerase sigma factor [Alphaproteobacteria bacterium]|nr:MAG: RNA polymerase sigma factor [Alphaproteobacteria bacterium]
MNRDALHRDIVKVLPRLRRFAFALTGARHDGDDLLQATIARILERDMPHDVALDKWCFRVCRNLWIDEVRARRVRTNAAAHDRGGADVVDGERQVTERITFREVNAAMAGLPDEQRAALALVALEGFSYAEAAEALDAPIGTIMSRIARARQALAKRLAAPADTRGRPTKEASL